MTTKLKTARVGIDIGRVVMCPTDEVTGADTSFLSASPELAMETPPAPAAEATIRAIVEETGGNAWYISKAGKRIQELTRQWFHHNAFFERAGIPEEHLHFCFKRHEKRFIAQRLGLTHFIDDRIDVLEPMKGVVPRLYLFGVQKRPAPDWVIPVKNWTEVSLLLLGNPVVERAS